MTCDDAAAATSFGLERSEGPLTAGQSVLLTVRQACLLKAAGCASAEVKAHQRCCRAEC